jgi:DNA (cytosine-5)-methyltransferase 1
MKTTASLFTGGGLFDIGAIAAGYTPIWGIEYDDKIAAVARLNGLPVMTADVCKVDYGSMERPQHLHASPPCPNFSVAKNGGKETEQDIALAHAVSIALLTLKPETFTLENVPAYIHSKSFEIIAHTLSDMGYWWDVNNLNAANFGVPQTRLRLWVRASRQLLRGYPPPVKWIGWYEAIADLIPSLPDTEFAPWQLARLPEEYKSFIIGQGTYSAPVGIDEPAQTITANNNQSAIKAFVLVANGDETVIHQGDEPIFTMKATQDKSPARAFVLDGANAGRDITIRDADQPIYSQTSSMDRAPARAYANGRVVKMTVQALGRFQSVPDSYKGLAVRINGNGVPPLMAQKILETL